MAPVDSEKLEYGSKVFALIFLVFFWLGIRRRSYSDFLASTVYEGIGH